MITLRFDKHLHAALTKRVAQYLQETDEAIARRIQNAKEDLALIPEASELYEQALVMLLTEVFCNVAAALRTGFGLAGDERLDGLVERALEKAIAARGDMDATRKERAS